MLSVATGPIAPLTCGCHQLQLQSDTGSCNIKVQLVWLSYCYCRDYGGICLKTIAQLKTKKEGTHSLEWRMIHCRMERLMTKTMMVIVMIMVLLIDGDVINGDGDGDEVGVEYVKCQLKMLHYWNAEVINSSWPHALARIIVRERRAAHGPNSRGCWYPGEPARIQPQFPQDIWTLSYSFIRLALIGAGVLARIWSISNQ